MSLDFPHYVAETSKTTVQSQERVKNQEVLMTAKTAIEAIERQKLSEKIVNQLERSILFKQESLEAAEIRNLVIEAKNAHDDETLKYIDHALSQERDFALGYLKDFSHAQGDDLSVLELQNRMRRSFLETTLYSRERTDTKDESSYHQDALRQFQLV